MQTGDSTVLLNADEVKQELERISRKIVEKGAGNVDNLALIGIHTRGVFLARRLGGMIADIAGGRVLTGTVDITLYRDDWTRIGTTPVVGKTELPFSIDDKTVILVDDVLFTGRTIRAAMDALVDYGRPSKIELVILVDRGDDYRELPIKANYVGGIWDVAQEETINVYLKEAGYNDHVAIEKKKRAA